MRGGGGGEGRGRQGDCGGRGSSLGRLIGPSSKITMCCYGTTRNISAGQEFDNSTMQFEHRLITHKCRGSQQSSRVI